MTGVVSGVNGATTRVRPTTLWASGVATAAVAAGVAVTGVALVAAVLALLGTAVLHLLMRAVPRPGIFLDWFLEAGGVIAAGRPFTTSAGAAAEVATARIGVVVVGADWSVLSSAWTHAAKPPKGSARHR